MKLITPTIMSKEAPAAWKHQYFDKEDGWCSGTIGDQTGGTAEERYQKALEAGRSKRNRVVKMTEALDESWTMPFCAECLDYVERAIFFELFGNQEATLCKACLTAALKRLK